MTFTEYAITKKTISWMFVLLLAVGGALSFEQLGRLEDPNFTIKQAMIVTRYPGATALEVEEEITLPIENAIQQLPYVKKIVSNSSVGLSQIEVHMKSIYRADDLAQIWDEMRRKLYDLHDQLPPGSAQPMINDDFGDVFGVFFAVTGEGFSEDELADYTDFLRRELVVIDGVGKVNIGGRKQEVIYIEMDRAKVSASGYSAPAIAQLLKDQNLVSDAGSLTAGSEKLRITTQWRSHNGLDSLRHIQLGSKDGQLIDLSDVATITKGFITPPHHIYHFNGQQALTLGVSFARGVNVVEVGQRIQQRIQELEYARPIGIELNTIYNQPQQVNDSVKDFLVGLTQAVAIVVLVLMVSMGWRPGLIMSSILLLTIAGTFIVMRMFNIELHRISLGALIIALGMLVDNAIVVTEGMLISIQRGTSRLKAAIKIIEHTRWPLLGATVIAITAFAPIGLSPDASGEFTGSLFWVLLISLLLSWILAVTLTPFFCYLMIKPSTKSSAPSNTPYSGKLYRGYKKLLHYCLHFRGLTLCLMSALLVSAIFAFGQVKQAFFPESSLPIFIVDYWLPEGTSINATEEEVSDIEKRLLNISEIESVTSTMGRGAERFMLTYAPEKIYPSFAQLIVRTHTKEQLHTAIKQTQAMLREHHPHGFTRFKRITVGPSTPAKIEARIIGPDPQILREIASQVQTVFRNQSDAMNIRHNWRERTKVLQPEINADAARRLGISQADINNAIKANMDGTPVGTYRYGSKILPIIVRPPEQQRQGVEQIEQVPVFSPVLNRYVNISQFILDTQLVWENPRIMRLDRKRTLSVFADPTPNSSTMALFTQLKGPVESIPLPQGYSIEWGGEYEAQQEANRAVFKFLPLGMIMMMVITVFMFNSIRQTLVIWITVPLAIIGVAYGLLLFNAPFSFTALLALLSLIGMQIKNGIVLVEEIKRLNEQENKHWHQAISEASVSRLRPVSMAALTTILGMIPLLGDVFFQPMAVTIMAGLGFATILTLIVVPVLFALFYKVKE